jgi:hypothetical protein
LSTPVFLAVSPTIPEPTTWAMMLIGFAGLCYAGYRRLAEGKRDGGRCLGVPAQSEGPPRLSLGLRRRAERGQAL